MSRPVSLPMYAAPPDALEAFWRGLRGHMLAAGLDDVPDRLSTPDNLSAHWRDPDLLLSQTCGFPLVTALAGRVHYVGTPHYRAPGCAGPNYSSAVVVRDDEPAQSLADMRGRRVAINSRDSQSGFNGLRALAAPHAVDGRMFASVLETGSHRASVMAVRSGQADLAAIDAVTLALLQRDEPESGTGLRILVHTTSVPGLPLITALRTSPVELDQLRAALRATVADPDLADVRAVLLLDGFSVVPDADYGVIAALQADAVARGYPDLD